MMKLIAHKINSSKILPDIPKSYGVEIDIRSGPNQKLVLSHDLANSDSEELDNYLKHYEHNFIVANIKESGIEDIVINKLSERSIDFFLLDCEMPFVYLNQEKYGEVLSVRYSEIESIETIKYFAGKVGWVWIDTFKNLPKMHEELKNFKTCLVSPDRWGRPEEITEYKNILNDNNFQIQGVMAELKYLPEWK